MLPEQGLPRDCGNNYFQMNSCVLAGSIQTTPQVSSGDSEAKPLIFTFVPTVRRLPTHSKLADTSKFLVKIPEEPSDKNPEAVNRSDSNEYLTLNAGSQRERDQGTLIYPSEVSENISQGRGLKANELQGMQQSDLFKAEYVFVVDSEGEDESTSGKGEQGPPGGMGTTASRPKSLAISSTLASDVVRPKTRGTDLQAPSHPEMSHGIAPPQKHGQLTSPTTSEQLACKPPAFSFVSPTNQKTPPDPVNLDGASVLEEFHTRRLDVSGALVEETATYFQTSAHSSPFFASKGTSSTLQFPHSTQLSGSNLSSPSAADQKPGLASEVLKKTTTLSSHVLSPRESPGTTSPSPSSSASLKSNSASYIPVRIVTHSLSPSPKPFTSSFHGSSSTICSQVSSSGNLSKSGVKSPVPSRLSLLTAILKSNPSHQRPFSPASCPTFSLNSLASSTLTLDQKAKQTPPTPKKSLSSCSLRAGSPEQREHQVSELRQQSFHLPFLAKSTPLSQACSLSPTKHDSSSLISLNVEKVSPTSLKSNPTVSLLQTDTSSSARLPPVPPSVPPVSLKGKQDVDLRGPEKPRNIHIHPTSVSSALSSLSPPTNQRAMLSSPEKCFHPSPALSNLINRSKRAAPQLGGQGQNLSTPLSTPVSSASSASLPKLGSSPLPRANLPTQALQLSPTLYPNCGSGTLPSRLGKSESSVSNHRSSVSTRSPPISLTRTKELISPYALSMSTGPENKKPKQYKTKSSYKAFAAIPTNTLLLEQKALDEPAKTESVFKDNTLDPPLEFCFPAQLRQQTEELCATIDKVLQDSLSMNSSDSPSSSSQTLLVSDTMKMPTTLPRAAGRETKYANLSSPSSTVSESQLTKPGVIRPVPVKSKILLKKEEEIYEPNPFSKYLEDDSDFFSEQDVTVPHKPVSLHPLYQTRLYPSAKSLLPPQTLSHADCLTPGPFSHLSSFSLSDEQGNSHTLFSGNTYNKVRIPCQGIVLKFCLAFYTLEGYDVPRRETIHVSSIFYLVFSTTTGHVDRKFSLTAISPGSLFFPLAVETNKKTHGGPMNSTERREGELDLHSQDDFSDVLAGVRLGFLTQEGSIYSESLQGFIRENSIFIDRETALKPQENIDSHSEDLFSFSFQKIVLSGGLICDCAAILFTFGFLKRMILDPPSPDHSSLQTPGCDQDCWGSGQDVKIFHGERKTYIPVEDDTCPDPSWTFL
ncbi:muscular LMNA-interacting protein [Lynx rufus]|uniref:muscular LMNA-interacting protein n=1 Tax=Lynx rufus TaxID=61384 RepID=UPI001F12770A|nr:muscular LMNA-interacting protein [Lynx rufus]